MPAVDLNADMGETAGEWAKGPDKALLDIVTSANVACGLHAGSPEIMAATMQAAEQKGVGIGAHPGFADFKGFGRQRMDLSAQQLASLIRYQLGAAQAIARGAGGRVRHLKLHGALANMAGENPDIARCCYRAALSIDPKLILVVMAQTAQQSVARELGCAWVGEIFADRAYQDDGTLVDRAQPGAVIHDPAEAGARVSAMLRAGAIITKSGKQIATRIDTICLHGDTPQAIAIARSVRNTLQADGIKVEKFRGS